MNSTNSINPENGCESPRSVLLRVMIQFPGNVDENILARAKEDYSALPSGINELEEEITLLQEILIRQEQTYNAEINDLEKQIKDCDLQLQKNESQNELLEGQIQEECRKDEDLKCIMDKYDEAVCELLDEKLKLQSSHNDEIKKIQRELKDNQEALSEIERKFAVLHVEYEEKKSRKIAMENDFQDLQYKLCLVQIALDRNETAYIELEKHAQEEIEKATQNLNTIRQDNIADCAKLNGQIKRINFQIQSLEELIKQKTKENAELQAIYDDCLSKMSRPCDNFHR